MTGSTDPGACGAELMIRRFSMGKKLFACRVKNNSLGRGDVSDDNGIVAGSRDSIRPMKLSARPSF